MLIQLNGHFRYLPVFCINYLEGKDRKTFLRDTY